MFGEQGPGSPRIAFAMEGEGGSAPFEPVDTPASEAPGSSDASLDSALSAAFDKLQTGEETQAGPARDQSGRFAPKDGIQAPDDQANQDATAQEQATVSAGTVPPSWSKRADLFAKAPPEVQAAIVERETEMARGVERFKGLAEFADRAEKSGTNLPTAVASYVAIEDMLASDFVGGIKEICRNFGIEPGVLAARIGGAPAAQGPSAQVEAQPAQPAARQPDPEVVALRSTVQSMQLQQAGREVEAFRSDPENKFFDEVSDHIARLISASRAAGDNLSLKDAYELAVRANPATSAKLQAQQKAAEAKAKVETATKAATTAQRAGKSLAGSAAGSQPAPKGSASLEHQLAEAYDRLAS